MISDPTFVPPSFDLSYHLKGKSKPKGQEKYTTMDYIITGRARVPNVPSAQTTGLLQGGVPTTKYQEPPTETPPVTQTEIQVDKLGFSVELSYDLEPQCDQVPTANTSPASYPACDSRTPPNDYYPPPVPIPHYHSYPPTIPHVPADASLYPQPHPTNYSTVTNSHFPPSPQLFSGPHVLPEYQGRFHFQAPNHPSGSLGMPPHHGFVEMGFGMRVPQQFRRPQHQQQQQQLHYVY